MMGIAAETKQKWKYILAYFTLTLPIAGLYALSDIGRYLNGVQALLTNASLYDQAGVVYPPFWYGLLSFAIGPLEAAGVPAFEMNATTILVVKAYLIAAVGMLVALTGVADDGEINKQWILFVLLNPVLFITTVLMGQAEALVALGIVAALHGWRAERWWLVGAGIALGTVMKFYPALMVVPLLARKPRRLPPVVKGALPISLFTLGLWVATLPSSLNMFSSKTPWITPMAVLGWADLLGYDVLGLANALFVVSIAIAVCWSILGRFEHPEVSLLVPLLPTMYFHTRIVAYRWVPLILAVGYLAYQYSDNDRRVYRRYVWALTGIGAVYQVAIIGLYSLTTKPVLRSTVLPDRLGWYSRETLPYVDAFSWLQVVLMVLHLGIGILAWRRLSSGLRIHTHPARPLDWIRAYFWNQ